MTPRKTTTSKAKITLAQTPTVKISFSTKKPSSKPPVSAAKARQLVRKIEAILARKPVTADSTCDEGTCAQITETVRQTLEAGARCTHSCQWFYSTGGGWRMECYYRCNDQYVKVEGTAS